ncbi:HD domain-containing protein [Brevundimonas sp.]|uniref:HD domain-containing protein n=1 Tax=Brevundimonas sp. TaxID=1871086 RepID=UPI002FD903CE
MISGAVRQDLLARYNEPHRAYHTFAHIEDCLAQVEASTDLSQSQRNLLTLTAWFHDAIYDPTRKDNEAESARLAVQALMAEGCSPADIAEVERLILLTAGHTVGSDDILGARLVSIDLSILGAEPARYDAYADAIRFEYGHVPDALYRPGRAAVMSRFLEANLLFPDPVWAERLDRQARANLKREIALLTA